MRLLLLLLLSSCLSAQELFRDRTSAAGIDVNGQARGVSICDYNGDGRPDLFVSVLDGPNRLYRNEGDFQFTEVGRQTPLATRGPTMLTLWGDLDNDGDEDVVVGNRGKPSQLFQAEGGTFSEMTGVAGFQVDELVQSGLLFDYNGDGLLDIYLTLFNAPNQLYRNRGNWRFEEVGGDAGAAQTGLAMGAIAFDYDLDGDSDLYLVHDGNQPNVLLRNEGGHYFTDVSTGSGADVVGDGMGVDVADYDGDGDFDIYVTNLYFNFLLRNEGGGSFTELGLASGVGDLGMGWGCAWLDYNNDGRPDLYVGNETNFLVGGERLPNIFYRNDADRFRPAATPDAAINSQSSTYGTATADFDGDGRMDLFVANSGQPSQLFQNVSPQSGNWLSLTLTPGSGHPGGIGSRVVVHANGKQLMREVRAGGSFASQHDRALHVGLGPETIVDSVVVYWPTGNSSRFYELDINRAYALGENEIVSSSREPTPVASLSVYPNPSAGTVNFTEALDRITVVDALGRVVHSHREPTVILQLDNLPTGLYRISGWRREHQFVASLFLQTY
jgi:hypothetical protein